MYNIAKLSTRLRNNWKLIISNIAYCILVYDFANYNIVILMFLEIEIFIPVTKFCAN